METIKILELQQKLDILSERVEAMEKKFEQMNSMEPLQMLVKQYRNNIWKLREKFETLTEEEERNLYQCAYYTIMQEKGSWIGIKAKIPNPPHFPHGLLGIFISNSAKIGNNVVIFQHVTIGSNSLADSNFKGSPIIGDDVYIGAGAKIIGKIKIGNNCRIGANAVIARDVPDNSLVVPEKPRIIHKENMDNKFYHWKNGKYGYYYNGDFFEVKN